MLAAWAASPARFREDANAEDDLVAGAYRDRLLVELAQNAADAAARAGVPGRLRLSLAGDALLAANTGAPLDEAGVEALATLRASAKRDGDTVGRFGVGFAAVLAVTDAPSVVSVPGGVRFSAADTLDAVAGLPTLADELARRDRHVPVLRLPWPAAADLLPDGFATEVRLPLRPDAVPAVRAALAALDPTLLLALPALGQIEVRPDPAGPTRLLSRQDSPDGTVLLRDGDRARRWRVRSAAGTIRPDLLAGRPAEERARTGWTLTWAVPVAEDGTPVPLAGRQVVHAPTPSDEPVSLPAMLVGTFPLGSDRRQVAPGPVTDLLVAEAARLYADLVADLPPVPAALALVPRPGVAAAELDAALCRAVLAALRDTPWLPAAAGPAELAGVDGLAEPAGVDGPAEPDRLAGVGGLAEPAGVDGPAEPDRLAGVGGSAEPAPWPRPGRLTDVDGAGRLRPTAAAVVDAAGPDLVDVLVDVLPGLLPAEWSGRGQAPVLAALGVRRLSTADVVEAVSGLDRPVGWWSRLYAAVATAPDRDALAALPVPLADGRTVTGAAGLLLPDAGLPAAAAAVLGLRVVHPDAAHPLLERLGAVRSSPRGVLADDSVRALVESTMRDDADPDPAPVAEAVLALVAAAGVQPGELPWLAELALPAADGDWYPAGELLLPGSPLAELVAADAPFGVVAGELVDRFGPDVLAAVGALTTFATLRVPDVDVDPDRDEHDLDGEADYFEAVLDQLPEQPVPPRLVELVAARDLELVRPDGWARALPALAALPGVAAPAVVVLADGARQPVVPYTRWWLQTHAVLDGHRPDRLRLPAAADLAGLYDPAAGDGALLEFAGCLAGLSDVLTDPDRAADLLDRLADPARTPSVPVLRDVYPRLAIALDGYGVEPPAGVRVRVDRVVDAGAAVVLDLPHLLPLLGDRVPVPAGGAPGAVADLLDLPFASEVVGPVAVASAPARRLRWADVPGAGLAAERCGGAVPADAEVAVHDGLRVAAGGSPVAAWWWPDGRVDHVDAGRGAAALGRALAWRLGRWDRRAAAAEALAAPGDADRLRAEDSTG